LIYDKGRICDYFSRIKNTYTALVERGSTEKALSQIFEAEGQLKKAIFHGSLSVREKRLP